MSKSKKRTGRNVIVNRRAIASGDDGRCEHGIREDSFCSACQAEQSPSHGSVHGVLNPERAGIRS